MKTNLENSFKNSLENYELPYDSNAWASLESKLNQRMPVKKSPSKWLIAASVVGLMGIAGGTYFYMNSTEQEPIKQTQKTVENHTSQSQNNEDLTKVKSINKTEEKTALVSNLNTQQTAICKGTQEDISSIKESKKETETIVPVINKQKSNETNDEQTNLVSIQAPNLKNICLGENVIIDNTNKASLVLVTPNQEEKTITGGKQLNFISNVEGKHQVGYYLGNRFVSIESFEVFPNPKADFTVDESSIYKQGVPTLALSASNLDLAYTWTFDGKKSNSKSAEVEAHFFTAGSHQIELTTTNKQGCKTTERKTINIQETYNLLAPNSFRPNEFDPKVNTFMPYALTERTSKFTLVIMDLNGNVLFKTSDANEGWNGVNPHTGQTYPSKTNFIWKVTLENPVEGERPFYNGTILIL
jgi:hypothetical protein